MRDTVRKWRGRFADGRLAGLNDAPRSGRPPVFTPRTGPRSRRWPARCRPSPACRCRGGAARNWPANWRPLPGRGLGVHGPPVAGQRRDQTLAAPVLDLHPRPRLRGQGRPGARPLRPDLGRRAARRRRVRDLRRREDLHPGPLPLPPHPAPGQGPHDAGRARVRARRRAGLPGRLRRPPRPGDRPLRSPPPGSSRSPAGRPGHDRTSPTPRTSGCSGSSTTAPPTAADRHRSAGSPARFPNAAWSTPPCTPPG